MKAILSRHIPFVLFNGTIFILLIGLINHSGTKHLDKIALVTASLYVFYFLFNKFGLLKKFIRTTIARWFAFRSDQLNIFLFVLTTGLFVIDIIVLNGLPGLKIFEIETTRQFSDLRANIHHDTHILFKYLQSINLRAILPFAMLHFLITKKHSFYLALMIIAPLYALAIMQKSFILILFMPALIYAIATKKYLHIVLHSFLIASVIFLLTYMPLRLKNVDAELYDNVEKPGTEQVAETTTLTSDSTVTDTSSRKKSVPDHVVIRVIKGISYRVFFLPGEIVSQWFEAIPSKKPFLNGDGYPFLAKLKGHTYRNYELELYGVFYPQYAAAGYAGSVNVATFVREYANFGYIGLVLAGFILALAFYIMALIFEDNVLLCICINLYPIFLLTSGNILTLMFSGGWAFGIFLYFIYKNQYPALLNKSANSHV